MCSCNINLLNDDNIIPEDAFIDVLVDIHIVDATIIVKGLRINTDSTIIKLYYNDIFLKHNVTQKQIQQTFEYYTSKPRSFEKLYEKVSEQIAKREEDLGDKPDEKLE